MLRFLLSTGCESFVSLRKCHARLRFNDRSQIPIPSVASVWLQRTIAVRSHAKTDCQGRACVHSRVEDVLWKKLVVVFKGRQIAEATAKMLMHALTHTKNTLAFARRIPGALRAPTTQMPRTNGCFPVIMGHPLHAWSTRVRVELQFREPNRCAENRCADIH